MTRVLSVGPGAPDPDDVSEASDVLLLGGVVVIPTDTVYGLAASAWNDEAVDRLFALKGRDRGKPIAVFILDLAFASGLVGEAAPEAVRLAARHWPGPVTLVVPAGPEAPPLLSAGTGSIGLRSPDHAFCRALLERSGPLAVTSANRSGEPPPRTAAEAVRGLLGPLDLVVDQGELPPGLPSTVVRVDAAGATVLRQGSVRVPAGKRAPA